MEKPVTGLVASQKNILSDTIIVLLLLVCPFCLVEGRKCHSDEYCCGGQEEWFGSYWDCTKCCNFDGSSDAAIGVIVGLAIGLPILVAVGVVIACYFCPGCPGHKRRFLPRQRSRPTPVIVMGRQNPGYYDGMGNIVIHAPAYQEYVPPPSFLSMQMSYPTPGGEVPPAYTQHQQQQQQPNRHPEVTTTI